jgi:hypothetical protein
LSSNSKAAYKCRPKVVSIQKTRGFKDSKTKDVENKGFNSIGNGRSLPLHLPNLSYYGVFLQ